MEELLTVKQVSEALKIGINNTYKLINEGKIPSLKFHGRKVKVSDLNKFISTLGVEECKTQ